MTRALTVMEEVKVSYTLYEVPEHYLRISSYKLKTCTVNQKVANIITYYIYMAYKLQLIKQKKIEVKWNNRTQ